MKEVGVCRGAGQVVRQAASQEEAGVVHFDEAVAVAVLGEVRRPSKGVGPAVVGLRVRTGGAALSQYIRMIKYR